MVWLLLLEGPAGQCCDTDGGIGGIAGPLLFGLVVGGWMVGRRAWIRWAAEGVTKMNRLGRIALLTLVVVAAAAMVIRFASPSSPSESPAVAQEVTVLAAPAPAKLPRILDLGATQCVPCKAMAPILADLKTEYSGRMQVDFIDVWKNEAAGQQYGISSIPTQIFFDAEGKELFRHVGFMSREDILAKCEELGFVPVAQR